MFGKLLIRVAGTFFTFSALAVSAQSDVRMQRNNYAPPKESSIVPITRNRDLAAMGRVAIERIESDRMPADTDGVIGQNSRKDCPPDQVEFCASMWLISRDELAKLWNEGEETRRAIILAVDRATAAGVTNWSQALANYRVWRLDYDDPGFSERAEINSLEARAVNRQWEKAERDRQSRLSEANCALDVWRERSKGGVIRFRSRVYCW